MGPLRTTPHSEHPQRRARLCPSGRACPLAALRYHATTKHGATAAPPAAEPGKPGSPPRLALVGPPDVVARVAGRHRGQDPLHAPAGSLFSIQRELIGRSWLDRPGELILIIQRTTHTTLNSQSTIGEAIPRPSPKTGLPAAAAAVQRANQATPGITTHPPPTAPAHRNSFTHAVRAPAATASGSPSASWARRAKATPPQCSSAR